MSVAIVTTANLGEKTNLKTAGMVPVLGRFAKEGELTQVLCQINTNFHFHNTSSAVPAPLRYGVRAVERLFGVSLASVHRALFDYCAQWRLQKADITIFHPALHERTIQKAKRLGSITVGIATVAHPLFEKEIHATERRKFGALFDPKPFSTLSATVNTLDYVIAYSDFVKSTYLEHGFPAEKVFVAYSDIPLPPTLSAARRDGLFTVLYVAYTSPRKGLQYLLDAWKSLHLPHAKLVLVGGYSGDMPKELRDYCDSIIKSDPSITWVGKTSDTNNYYREASTLVLPSLSEGNPKVVMEAMAHGLPVVTTTNAQSVVEDGKSGFVVPIRDVNALKEKITYLYNNRDIALRMGKEGRRVMEHKKPFGEAVFEICREIMKRNLGT